jgi:drug/metabolite transporter (DMT)-like permease
LSLSKTGLAKLSCIYSGLVFGIYWFPLRELQQAGLGNSWAILMFTAGPVLFLLPLLIVRLRAIISSSGRFHLICGLCGVAYVMYGSAFLYTEVVRVIVMFYLMPIWGFLVARIFIGEKITPVRWLSMTLGVLGLVTICGFDNGIPLQNNSGDWMALGAGIIWACASTLLLTSRGDPVNYTVGFMTYSAIVAAIFVTIAVLTDRTGIPDVNILSKDFIWTIPFALLVLIPAAFATMFGPTQLNPGIVGLLFMTEISVGTVTAALFANEPFGQAEVIGVVLITLAGISEPIVGLFRNRKSISIS